MQRILVLNSFGPMGSTLLAGLLEKLGFTNLPVRKLNLHQYLMGENDLHSGMMQSRLRENLISHSKPGLRGGVSVTDRDGQKPAPLTDYALVKDRIDALEPASIRDLYFACRNIYADAVTYKQVATHRDWHIELTVDTNRYDPQALMRGYKENFPAVYMIHLHRPFAGWINSLASQVMIHPDLRQRLRFFPHMRHKDYLAYERTVTAIPGLHIQFDELFDKPIEDLSADIARFLDVPPPTIDWRNESYDLYGKIVPWAKAFKRYDDNIEYLSRDTIAYYNRIASNGDLKKSTTRANSWLRYLIDMRAYRKRL